MVGIGPGRGTYEDAGYDEQCSAPCRRAVRRLEPQPALDCASGKEIANTDGLTLIHADQPWRTDWLSFGLYDDGWTRPGVTARVRVFATPGQHGPVLRGITFGVRAPDGVTSRPFELSSNQGVAHGSATADTLFEPIRVCVPAGGYADVRLQTPESSAIPGDLATLASSLQPRAGGVFVSLIGLADEVGGACTVPAAGSS
jgi:hypothetical protein